MKIISCQILFYLINRIEKTETTIFFHYNFVNNAQYFQLYSPAWTT